MDPKESLPPQSSQESSKDPGLTPGSQPGRGESSSHTTGQTEAGSSQGSSSFPQSGQRDGREPEKEKLTLNDVQDQISNFMPFHCSPSDPNAELYVFANGAWHGNGYAENIILATMGRMFENEEDRTAFRPERVIEWVKSQALCNSQREELPPHAIPFVDGFLFVKEFHIPGEGKLNRTKQPMEREALSGRWFYANLIPHRFDPEAKCPKWLEFLSEVVYPEDVPFLQEWMGYQFYRDYPEAAFLILTGSGQNGKSVFLEMMMEMLGADNITNISLADLTYDDFAPAGLRHRLANISDDIGNTAIKNVGMLRAVSAGSKIYAQKKFGHGFDLKPYAKITYSCNEPPEIRDESDALKYRLKVVEFPYTFVKQPLAGQKQAKDRKELVDGLKAEIPGIINWALQGLIRFLGSNSKFSYSRSTDEVWRFYKRRSKPVLSFWEEGVEHTGSDEDYIEKEDLFQAFRSWLGTKKVKRDVSRDKFFRDLKNEGIEAIRSREHDMKRLYFGVKLIECSNVPTLTRSPAKTECLIVEKEGERKEGEIEESNSKGWNIGTVKDSFPEELQKILVDLDARYPDGIPLNDFWVPALAFTKERDLPEEYVKAALKLWEEGGVIFSPQPGFIKKR